MSYDVIVLGLGAMGSATTFHLTKRGAKVLGLEQFEIGHVRGSSHGQSRIIRKAYFEHPDYVPLLLRAYELWSELEKHVGQKLYHETGIVYFNPSGSKITQSLFKAAKFHKISIEKREPTEFSTLFKIPEGFEAIFEPEAGYLEVENCVRAHVKAAKYHGAEIVEKIKVSGWSSNASGVRVVANDQTYLADKLVIASGAWTPEILKELGLPLTLLKKTMYWFDAPKEYEETSNMPCYFFEMPDGVFYGFPKSNDHGLKIALHSGGKSIENPSDLDLVADPNERRLMRSFAKVYLPKSGPQLSSQNCMYTMTPDEHFILDIHPTQPRVSFAAGFSGHGFKFSSVVGEIMADLAITNTTKLPINFLRLSRFKK